MIEHPITELSQFMIDHGYEGYWYLATPYSKWLNGLEDANIVAQKLAARLIEAEVPIFSPIAHTHGISTYVTEIDKRDFDFWLGVDKPLVDMACGLLIADLKGWQESRGVNLEINWFAEAKKPVWLLNTKTLAFRAFRL